MFDVYFRGHWYPVGTHFVIKRGGYDHHVILVGGGGLSLSPAMIIDNAKVLGVALRLFDEVAGNDPIEVVEYPQSDEHAATIVGRAYSMIGSGYALINWNCESFARWCVTGVSHSYQVRRGVAAGLVLLGLFLSGNE